jgi:GNAT superfamily N-acetyltransferase
MTWTGLKAAVASLGRTPRLLIAQKLVRRLPFRPMDIGKLCFLRLERVPDVPAAMLRGSAGVRLATPEDLDGLVQLQDKKAAFVERFANGDWCVVADVDGEIVGYEWFCENPVHHESAWGYPIDIPGGFVYAYDAYIDPAYRNTGVWLRFKAFLGEWMTAHGKRGVLTFVEYGNWPSLRTHMRFGFEPSESVLTLRLIGWRFFRRVRAIGTTTWSYAACIVMHQAPALLHHGARALHLAAVVVRK